MRRKKLRHILTGAAIAIVVVVPLGAFAYVKSGLFNVAAFRPHTKLTEWITHETMIHSVRHHAEGIVPPRSASTAQVVRGFCAYETHCVACHGASAVARERWVSGMEPQPPYLIDVSRQFTPGQLFWITKNGIKMTGMPAWGESMSDPELWDVVAFLEATPKMNSTDYLSLRERRRCHG